MRKIFHSMALALSLVGLALFVMGCDGTTATTGGTVNLMVTGSGGGATPASTRGMFQPLNASFGGVTITTALASFREIEFILAGEDPAMAQQEPEFEATFYVDLLAPNTTGTLLGSALIPPGTYAGIEFKLDATPNPPTSPTDFSNLTNNSVYVAGTANGVAFTLSLTASSGGAQIVVTGPNGFTVDANTTSDLVIDFNLPGVLAHPVDAQGTTVAALIVTATTGQSGTVDLTSNVGLTTVLLDALHAEAHSGEDENHDGHLDDTEDVH